MSNVHVEDVVFEWNVHISEQQKRDNKVLFNMKYFCAEQLIAVKYERIFGCEIMSKSPCPGPHYKLHVGSQVAYSLEEVGSDTD
jgi:hypothetical protein